MSFAQVTCNLTVHPLLRPPPGSNRTFCGLVNIAQTARNTARHKRLNYLATAGYRHRCENRIRATIVSGLVWNRQTAAQISD